MDDLLLHRLDTLAYYVISSIQHLTFEPGLNWWMISPSFGLQEHCKGSFNALLQLGFNEDKKEFQKLKLSSLIEKRFGDKFRMVKYNKKLYITVVGMSREEHGDCPLPATMVKSIEKKWIGLNNSIVAAAGVAIMQQKALDILEAGDDNRKQA
jgi:hypothetical protein